MQMPSKRSISARGSTAARYCCPWIRVATAHPNIPWINVEWHMGANQITVQRHWRRSKSQQHKGQGTWFNFQGSFSIGAWVFKKGGRKSAEQDLYVCSQTWHRAGWWALQYKAALNEAGRDENKKTGKQWNRSKVFDCRKSWLFEVHWPQICSENRLSDNSHFRFSPLPSLLNLNFYLHPSSGCWGA